MNIKQTTLEAIQKFINLFQKKEIKKYCIFVESENKCYVYSKDNKGITRFVEALTYYKISKKKVR